MQGYFGNQISARLSSTPEGFLICQGAVLCRSGFQTYRGAELNLPDFSGSVKVYRPPEEVLAPAFLASLNGKCITNEHPQRDWVSSENARFYCAGHCQNIRQGPDLPNGDVTIIGDLVVMDASLIHKIENGTRELSCGYNYRLESSDDGTYEMRDLVANHLAVVPTGRAGPMCAILDHALEQGRPCSCPRELSRLTARDDVAEVNFLAATRRFLGKNIMDVRNR
jgi:hypothetical protein